MKEAANLGDYQSTRDTLIAEMRQVLKTRWGTRQLSQASRAGKEIAADIQAALQDQAIRLREETPGTTTQVSYTLPLVLACVYAASKGHTTPEFNNPEQAGYRYPTWGPNHDVQAGWAGEKEPWADWAIIWHTQTREHLWIKCPISTQIRTHIMPGGARAGLEARMLYHQLRAGGVGIYPAVKTVADALNLETHDEWLEPWQHSRRVLKRKHMELAKTN